MRAPTHISSCLELNLGDEINATYKGALVHHGHVTELAPDHNLFWILDDFVGGRRLIDMVELSIYRIPAAATN